MSNVESTVITLNPLLVGSGLHSSSYLISMETSDPIPGFGNDALLEVAATTSPNTSHQIDMFPLIFFDFICILFCTYLVLYLFTIILVIFVLVLSSSQKDLAMPTLVSLVVLIPYFYHPFTKTSLPESPKIATPSDKDILDRARTCLMEGMHLLNEVSTRTRTRAQILALNN